MTTKQPPRGVQDDMDRLADIERSYGMDQIRFVLATVFGAVSLLTGGFLAMYPILAAMLIAWHASTTAENAFIGVVLGALAAVAAVVFVGVSVAPAAWTWMQQTSNAAAVQAEKRELLARINLWHATGGNQWSRAALSLVYLLDELGQGPAAHRAVDHLIALKRRSDLLERAAGYDAEADQAKLVVDDQAAEILDRLGNLALEAARSDRLPLEELEQAESDAKNRARALAEVSAAAKQRRTI